MKQISKTSTNELKIQKPILQKANSETQADNIFDETKKTKEEYRNSVSKSDSEEIQKILDNTNESENNTTRKESPKTPWDSIKDIFNKTSGDKDGKIGNTKQKRADCWILSAINAINYTEVGKELIKNSLQYDNDGAKVKFKGYDKPIYVPDFEIKAEKEGAFPCASGDKDMARFEIAVEKMVSKLKTEELIINDEDYNKITPADLNNQGIQLKYDGGYSEFVFYLLSGKIPEKYTEKEDIEKALNEFQANNCKNYALGFAIETFDDKENVKGLSSHSSTADTGETKYTIKDNNGKKQPLGAPHAYAIKEVTDDTVTVINPWNSKKKIVLSKEQFMGLCDSINVLDLSNNNSDKKCLIETQKEIIENPDGTETKYIKDENGTILRQYEYDKDKKILKKIKNRTKDGKLNYEKEYHENRRTKSERFLNYYDNGNIQLENNYTYDENGNETKFISYAYYENGVLSNKSENILENGKAKTIILERYDRNGNLTNSETIEK